MSGDASDRRSANALRKAVCNVAKKHGQQSDISEMHKTATETAEAPAEPRATYPAVQSQGNGAPEGEIGSQPNSPKVTLDGKEKPKESKAERFARLAPKRMTKALKALAGIKALCGSNYSATEEQAQRIVGDLVDAVASIQAAFSGEKARKAQGWNF